MATAGQNQGVRGASRLSTLSNDFYRDVRYAVRNLRRTPGFTAIAVFCLGLGTAVTTATFSIADSVLLRRMPVANAERLVILNRGADSRAATYLRFLEFRARSRTLAGLAAAFPMESDIDVEGQSEFVVAEVVSANYSETLGLGLVLGRWFVDDQEPVAIISYDVWQRRFNLRPDVLGTRILSQSQSYIIVGVAPREFTGVFAPLRTDIWVPIRTRPSLLALLEAPTTRINVMQFGRMQADTAPREVSAEINAIEIQLQSEQGVSTAPRVPLAAELVGGIPDRSLRKQAQDISALLSIAAILMFLIACINVGNLLTTRGIRRQREVGMRLALGATRSRLLRQLLTESLVLAIASAIFGLILASGTIRLLSVSMPRLLGAFDMDLKLALDWRAFAFAVGISFVATLACGVLPALGLSSDRKMIFQRELVPGASRRLPIGLVGQVVMSLVLLLVAASFLQSILRLQGSDPGFDVKRQLFSYTFVAPKTEGRSHLYADVKERVLALPGVQTVALASTMPLMPFGGECAAVPSGSPIRITSNAVSEGYFDAMGIGLVSGRDFSSVDQSSGQTSVVLNESLARMLSPAGGTVGSVVVIGCQTAKPAMVVGVVRDSAIKGLNDRSQPHAYQLLDSQALGMTVVVVKTSGNPAALVDPLRRTLLDVGQGMRVFTTQSLQTHVEKRYAPDRWLVSLLIGFALLALVLAAIGLYSTMAYRVAVRTPEFGVRMALGASRRQVFRSVLAQGLAIVITGVVVAEILTQAAIGLVGWIRQGIGPVSLVIHLAVWLIWLAIALAACLLPAARAARTDPMVALRYD